MSDATETVFNFIKDVVKLLVKLAKVIDDKTKTPPEREQIVLEELKAIVETLTTYLDDTINLAFYRYLTLHICPSCSVHENCPAEQFALDYVEPLFEEGSLEHFKDFLRVIS